MQLGNELGDRRMHRVAVHANRAFEDWHRFKPAPRNAYFVVDEKHAGHVAPVARAHALRGATEAMYEYDPARVAGWPGALLFAVAEPGSADDEGLRERRIALDELLARRHAAGQPPARVVRFTGVGHNLMRYRPDELAAAIAALIGAGDDYQRS